MQRAVGEHAGGIGRGLHPRMPGSRAGDAETRIGVDAPIVPAAVDDTPARAFLLHLDHRKAVHRHLGVDLLLRLQLELDFVFHDARPEQLLMHVLVVGEDQAKLPMPQALMKAVNKFQGYEHVKVSLEPTPRGTGMSFTQLRNALKQGTQAEQFNIWNNAFNDPEFGAKPLPKSWIEHLMAVSKQGMGLKESQLKTLNQLIREGLQAL